MRDEGLVADKTLTSSQRAVKYILERIPVDVNLRHHMLGTEAFNLFCAAEAERTGQALETVTENSSKLSPHCRGEQPRICELAYHIEELEGRLEQNESPKKKIPTRDHVLDDPTERSGVKRLLEFIRERDGYSVMCAAQFTLRAELEIEVRV